MHFAAAYPQGKNGESGKGRIEIPVCQFNSENSTLAFKGVRFVRTQRRTRELITKIASPGMFCRIAFRPRLRSSTCSCEDSIIIPSTSFGPKTKNVDNAMGPSGTTGGQVCSISYLIAPGYGTDRTQYSAWCVELWQAPSPYVAGKNELKTYHWVTRKIESSCIFPPLVDE